MKRAYADSERNSTREFRSRPGIIETPLLKPVLTSGALFLGALIAVAAAVVWFQLSRGRFPLSYGLAAMAFAIVLGSVMTWLTGVGMTTIGIALSSEGVEVFERQIRPGRGIHRRIPWDDVGPLKLNPGGFRLTSEGIGVNLTLPQAQALVRDSRYRFRSELTADVRSRLGTDVWQA